jgi:hypothetical protein
MISLHQVKAYHLVVVPAALSLATTNLTRGGCRALTRQISILEFIPGKGLTAPLSIRCWASWVQISWSVVSELHPSRLHFEVIRSCSAFGIVNSLRLVSAPLTLPQSMEVGKAVL